MPPHLSVDHLIAQAAAPRGGVITRPRLRSLGLTDDEIDYRVATGRLYRVYRGVYLVGHPHLCGHGHRWAALLACGRGAVLSHRSAAAAWDMLYAPATVVDVTVPSHAGRVRRSGIRVRRSKTLTLDVCAVRNGLPVTCMARTLLDIAATESPRTVEMAVEGADAAGVFDLFEIERLAPRGEGIRGAKALYAVLDAALIGTTITRSGLEEAMLALCRRFGLPQPAFNQMLGPWEVDCLWRSHRLVVEVQSTTFHRTKHQVARDADKEADLMAAGYDVLHVADVHVIRRPKEVARRVEGLLARPVSRTP